MKAVEFKRHVRPLLPAEERWEFYRTFCYRAPVGLFAFGVLGEGSAFDQRAYIWKVSMPLFVPDDHINLSFSDRVGGPARKYSSVEPGVLHTAIKVALDTKHDERAELRRLVKLGHRSPNIRLIETAAYSAALLDDDGNATRIASRATGIEVEQDWAQDVKDRVIEFGHLIRDRGAPASVELLKKHAHDTASVVGLAT